jgi:hypothetical protein
MRQFTLAVKNLAEAREYLKVALQVLERIAQSASRMS